MKKIFAPVLILCSFLFLMGMGDLGSSVPVEKIPAPEKNFNVQVTDSEGVQTSLSEFSMEGKIFLEGKRGSGVVAIPFDKISQIQFRVQEGNDLPAEIMLKDRKSAELKVDKRSKFYGKADFGTYQIEAKDLRSINFQP